MWLLIFRTILIHADIPVHNQIRMITTRTDPCRSMSYCHYVFHRLFKKDGLRRAEVIEFFFFFWIEMAGGGG